MYEYKNIGIVYFCLNSVALTVIRSAVFKRLSIDIGLGCMYLACYMLSPQYKSSFISLHCLLNDACR